MPTLQGRLMILCCPFQSRMARPKRTASEASVPAQLTARRAGLPIAVVEPAPEDRVAAEEVAPAPEAGVAEEEVAPAPEARERAVGRRTARPTPAPSAQQAGERVRVPRAVTQAMQAGAATMLEAERAAGESATRLARREARRGVMAQASDDESLLAAQAASLREAERLVQEQLAETTARAATMRSLGGALDTVLKEDIPAPAVEPVQEDSPLEEGEFPVTDATGAGAGPGPSTLLADPEAPVRAGARGDSQAQLPAASSRGKGKRVVEETPNERDMRLQMEAMTEKIRRQELELQVAHSASASAWAGGAEGRTIIGSKRRAATEAGEPSVRRQLTAQGMTGGAPRAQASVAAGTGQESSSWSLDLYSEGFSQGSGQPSSQEQTEDRPPGFFPPSSRQREWPRSLSALRGAQGSVGLQQQQQTEQQRAAQRQGCGSRGVSHGPGGFTHGGGREMPLQHSTLLSPGAQVPPGVQIHRVETPAVAARLQMPPPARAPTGDGQVLPDPMVNLPVFSFHSQLRRMRVTGVNRDAVPEDPYDTYEAEEFVAVDHFPRIPRAFRQEQATAAVETGERVRDSLRRARAQLQLTPLLVITPGQSIGRTVHPDPTLGEAGSAFEQHMEYAIPLIIEAGVREFRVACHDYYVRTDRWFVSQVEPRVRTLPPAVLARCIAAHDEARDLWRDCLLYEQVYRSAMGAMMQLPLGERERAVLEERQMDSFPYHERVMAFSRHTHVAAVAPAPGPAGPRRPGEGRGRGFRERPRHGGARGHPSGFGSGAGRGFRGPAGRRH